MPNKLKRIIDGLELKEISGVDKPAMEPARAAIIKNQNGMVEDAREAAETERERIIFALEGQKVAAGRDIDSLREVLDRAQSISFALGEDSLPELTEFIRVTVEDLQALGDEERTRATQRANAGRTATKSGTSLLRKAAQIEALAETLAKSSAPSRDDVLELKKLANDTCSEFMEMFDSVETALADAEVQRLYSIANQLDGLAARIRQ